VLASGVLPARSGWCGGGGLQVAVHLGDGGRAFADGGGDPFDRSVAHVAGSKPPPRWLSHSPRNSVIERWNSSAGVCTGRFTQWSIVPTLTASKTDRSDCQSPQPTTATRSAVGSMARIAASTSMPSGSCAPTRPMTSATGRPAARRSRIQGASSAGRPQTTI
jgi:hypothetical protein